MAATSASADIAVLQQLAFVIAVRVVVVLVDEFTERRAHALGNLGA
jgi:hypothetical protein